MDERRQHISQPPRRGKRSLRRCVVFARRATVALLCTLIYATAAGEVRAQQRPGSSGIQAKLNRTLGIGWDGVPLRQALDNLSQAQGIAVLIDRRVDPGRKLTLTVKDVSLGELFAQIADDCHIGYCQFGPVAYFGPRKATSRLRTIAALRREDIRKLPTAVARKFLRQKRMRWQDFATPRELLDKLAEEEDFQIEGVDRIEHDLWAAADLPLMSLADRLTLLVGQFGLTFEIDADGKRITLVDAPAQPALVRSYPGGSLAAKKAARWEAIIPNAQIKLVGGKIYVKGLLEEHEALTAPPKTVRRPNSDGPSKDTKVDLVRIDRLTVEGIPLGNFLNQLAKRLKLDLKIDHRAIRAAGISLDQNVSLRVEKVTVDELFQTAIKSTGLTYRRVDRVVEISAGQ